MTRYAQRYEESQAELRKVEARLADAEFYRDQYRLFINEGGHADAFLRWLADRQGLVLNCLKSSVADEQSATADRPQTGKNDG